LFEVKEYLRYLAEVSRFGFGFIAQSENPDLYLQCQDPKNVELNYNMLFIKQPRIAFESFRFFFEVLSQGKFLNYIFVLRHFCVTWKWHYTSFKTTKPFYEAIPPTIRLSVILTGTTAVKKESRFLFK
jgi:hypothetical protein